MEISIKYQLITALLSVFIGVFIGLIYDAFKIFRILSGLEFSSKLQKRIETIKLPIIKGLKIKNTKFSKIKRKILYVLWDLLFFVVITPIMQVFIYATSSGVVRWYIILGAFLGFIIYYFTVSKIVSIVYEYTLLVLKIIFSYITYFIRLPFNKLILVLKIKLKKHKEKLANKKTSKKKKTNTGMRQKIVSYGKCK